ncbi:MAG TPA: DUF308 domain-containing protein [Pseudolysinimonas sp.]|nr:DUF308 domain-containing protein [Pseudolysinimonas sp.]
MTDSAVSSPLTSFAKGLWWLVLLRGVLAIVFGIIALLAPGAALTAVAIVYGAYALVDGLAAIVHALQSRGTNPRWGWMLGAGIVSVLAGLAALILPGLVGALGGLVVLWTIAIWAVVSGVMALRSAGGSAGRARTWAIVAGVLSLLFGVVLAVAILVNPGATLLSLIWTAGVWAVIFGVLLVVTAFTVRRAVATAA